MPTITPLRRNIVTEEVQFRSAVSESTWNKIGGSLNFVNERQYQEKVYNLNGPYSIGSTYPFNGIDGLTIVQFDMTIINVYIFNITNGTSGTTELDLKRIQNPAGAAVTIFSTTPKFTSAAAANTWIGVGETVTGMTAPVLSTTDIDAGDALRFDMISAVTGAFNTGLIVIYRPR